MKYILRFLWAGESMSTFATSDGSCLVLVVRGGFAIFERRVGEVERRRVVFVLMEFICDWMGYEIGGFYACDQKCALAP